MCATPAFAVLEPDAVTEPNAIAAIAQTPRWFPHRLDPAGDRLTLLRMDEEDYRKASFLDERVIGPASESFVADWDAVARAVPAGARRDVQYIFHIGNVGSTLISRFLGEVGTVLALREPLLLRTFHDMIRPLAAPARWSGQDATDRIDLLNALLARTFRPDQRAIVKATSFTSELGWRLVPPGSRALFLFAAPQPYIENILAGENSRRTLDMLGQSRLARLRSRCQGLSLDLGTLTAARKAALAWACEMTSLDQSAARLPAGSAMWLDFDRFLASPADNFAAIVRHFGHSIEPAAARAICEGPLVRRYSKAPEYEYSPALRREILAEARWKHGAEIRDALAWLNALANRCPAVAQAIRRLRQ